MIRVLPSLREPKASSPGACSPVFDAGRVTVPNLTLMGSSVARWQLARRFSPLNRRTARNVRFPYHQGAASHRRWPAGLLVLVLLLIHPWPLGDRVSAQVPSEEADPSSREMGNPTAPASTTIDGTGDISRPSARQDPFADLTAAGGDPFADLDGALPATLAPSSTAVFPARPKRQAGTTRTFFKQELFEQLTWQDGGAEPYRRLSYGGELLQRFSDPVKTWGSFNLQLRLVNRAAFLPTQNDVEGEDRQDWHLEYHNAYLDLFNAFDSFLSPSARARHLGRFNLRIGRFYLPSGINLQTDTHGTLLQLSNERNFGFERDWFVGLWGGLSPDLTYDLYALAGSGYELRREGQKGLLGLRIALANRFLFEHGWEGGVSWVTGERLSPHALMRSPGVAARADDGRFIETRRLGLDARHTRPVPFGTMTLTGEWTVGRDESDDLFSQVYQIDLLRRDRRLGWALQFRRFRQEIGPGPLAMGMGMPEPGTADASLIGEVTWYFRNDIGNANLHWLKLQVERQTERLEGPRGVLTTLQYYRYW